MKNQLNSKYSNYLQENITLYIFTIVLFIMGIVLGSYLIYSLSGSQKQEILSTLNLFFSDINNLELNTQIAFREILYENIKYLLIIWFLGLSIVGMPLIFIIIYLKGLVVGFTISFFIFEMNWRGLLVAIIVIIPQNILIVPVLIIAGVSGVRFSISLIKSRKDKNFSYLHSFKTYLLISLMLVGILVIASSFEAFVSPSLMRGVGAWLN